MHHHFTMFPLGVRPEGGEAGWLEFASYLASYAAMSGGFWKCLWSVLPLLFTKIVLQEAAVLVLLATIFCVTRVMFE